MKGETIIAVCIGAGVGLLATPWITKAVMAYAFWVMAL